MSHSVAKSNVYFNGFGISNETFDYTKEEKSEHFASQHSMCDSLDNSGMVIHTPMGRDSMTSQV